MLQVGDILHIDGRPHIVTETKSGVVAGVESLDNYICRTRVIQHNGQYMSIQDLINRERTRYITNAGGLENGHHILKRKQ